MECPRCKLMNPDTAERCDCGYDFIKGTVEKAYYKQEIPTTLKFYLKYYFKFATGMNILAFFIALLSGNVINILFYLIWTGIVYYSYLQLLQKKNWARITLGILMFPVGLGLLSQEAKLYFLQTKN